MPESGSGKASEPLPRSWQLDGIRTTIAASGAFFVIAAAETRILYFLCIGKKSADDSVVPTK